MPAAPGPEQPAEAKSAWAHFRGTHLFDYNPTATRLWLALVGAGWAALAWALFGVALLPGEAWAELVIGLCAIAVTASFPIHIPRTRYSIGVGDVFVFLLLARHGAEAAVLGAGVEGAVAVINSSARLSSRVATPAVAALAMTVSGMAAEALGTLLARGGVSVPLAQTIALCAVALPYFAGSTLPLMALFTLKQGRWPSLRSWWDDYAWVAAIFLASAAAAGTLHLNAVHYGPGVLSLAMATIAILVWTVNRSIARLEVERREQEACIAEAQKDAELGRQRFAASFSHAAIAMALTHPDGRVLQANQALCALLGRTEGELLGYPFSELLHAADRPLFERSSLPQPMSGSEAGSVELRCAAAGARDVWVVLHSSRFPDPAGCGDSVIYQLLDVTARRRAEQQLHHIAYHDDLTGLGNRNCFHQRLALAVERSRVNASYRFAVVFIDLDRFKLVNDSLGHHVGNELLREIGRRLSGVLRTNDLVARLGGDEFAVLLEDVADGEVARVLAERLHREIGEPLHLAGTAMFPQASVGVTLSDLGYRSVDELLRDADLAMYEAKAAGRSRVVLYDASMRDRLNDRVRLEADLRHAIETNQLSLVYQPLFRLDSMRLVGFEALMRWSHPERGMVPPSVFVAVAEDSGLIAELTAWAIDRAVAQLVSWQRSGPRWRSLTMNVNISGRDLVDPRLAQNVCAAIERHRLEPATLVLEITETMLMNHLSVALQTLAQLRRMGVRLAIDDFGTGYSSLSYLSTLPIDSLKIDRSFVSDLAGKPTNADIIRAVLTLARSTGKQAVAEGIETEQELAVLRSIGVEMGQGYLLSRPLRVDQIRLDELTREPA